VGGDRPDDGPAGAPRVTGILETVLYFSDEARTEAFYSGVLGLRLVSREPGRGLFYRVGSGMLLLFAHRVAREGGKLPPHGAEGPIHVCFRVPPEAYDAWKEHLPRRGVPVLHEATWPNGRSLYFRDPDANLLEIVDADIWPS